MEHSEALLKKKDIVICWIDSFDRLSIEHMHVEVVTPKGRMKVSERQIKHVFRAIFPKCRIRTFGKFPISRGQRVLIIRDSPSPNRIAQTPDHV